MLTLITPDDNAKFSVLTKVQQEFLRRERPLRVRPEIRNDSTAYPWLSKSFTASVDLSRPACVIFKWKVSDLCSPMTFEISTNADFSRASGLGSVATLSDIFVSADEPNVFCVRADNLLSGTTYYWRVTSGDASETRSFSTAYGEIRPIRIGGITNVRDLGGRINAVGKRVKQGLVYRGPAFDDLVDTECAGNDGLKIARHDLAVKTDIDLRADSVDKYNTSLLGDDVKYIIAPIEAEGATLNDGGRTALRTVLEHIADEKNYPIYFHCQVGADRTGTIAMYLDAILGMAPEDLILNYNFTSLAKDLTRSWYHTDGPVAFFDFLEETYPENTITERLLINLRKSGISKETIERIRNNLLEK